MGAKTGEALLVIDMQKYFFDENQKLNSTPLIANCQAAIGYARAASMPIIPIITEYRPDRTDWPRAWRQDPDSWCASLVTGHPLAALVDRLGIDHKEDFGIVKKHYNAFHETGLDILLEEELGCDRIFAIGYAADVCVRETLFGAYDRNYDTAVIEEAVEPFRVSKETALDDLNYYLGTERFSLTDFREHLLE